MVRPALALMAAMCVLGVLAERAAAADPQPSCGEVVTASVTLTQHVADCPGDGLIVGASDITIDLAGHTVSAAGPDLCDGPCTGIENSAGYDRVRIVNGTVAGFGEGVLFDGADGGTLSNLAVGGGSYGGAGVAVALLRSDRTAVDGVRAQGGDPAVLISDADANTITGSDIDGGVAIRVGDGLRITAGSDGTRVRDTKIDGEHFGFDVLGSDTTLSNVDASAYGGNIVREAMRTRVVGSHLGGGQASGLRVLQAQSTTIEGNEIDGYNPLSVADSTDTTITRNHVSGAFFDTPNIEISGGAGTVLRRNVVAGGAGDGIYVGESALGVLLFKNIARAMSDDGIDVRSSDTVIRRNTAYDNGDLGIEAVDGATDGGGNRAYGNGNALQCVGVRCRSRP